MMQERFRNAELEYLKLRGEFDAGRLGADQLDDALRELSVQDTRGRSWMLGANTGRWYVYNGSAWVESDPFARESEQANPTASAAGEGAAEVDTSARSRLGFGLFAGMGLAVLIAAAILMVTQLGSLRNVSAGANLRSTPGGGTLSVTQVAAVSPTPRASVTAALPGAGKTTAGGATPPVTTAPRGGATAPDAASAANTPVPSDTPTRVTTSTRAAINTESPRAATAVKAAATTQSLAATRTPPPPTRTRVPTATRVPPTRVPAVSQPPAPGLAPDVYVTALRVSNAHRQAPVTFTASFLNTTGAPRHYPWRIVLLDPNKPGRNKDWGQSMVVEIDVPPGASQFSISYIAVTNGGGCIPLQALAAWVRQDNARIFFPYTDGNILGVNFDVC